MQLWMRKPNTIVDEKTQAKGAVASSWEHCVSSCSEHPAFLRRIPCFKSLTQPWALRVDIIPRPFPFSFSPLWQTLKRKFGSLTSCPVLKVGLYFCAQSHQWLTSPVTSRTIWLTTELTFPFKNTISDKSAGPAESCLCSYWSTNPPC